MSDNIKAILKKLREVEQAATEGPWGADEGGFVTTRTQEQIAVFDPSGDVYAAGQEEANAEFAALARTAQPVLREAVERLHGLQIEGLRVVYKADVDRIIADALAPLKELLEDKP
jgi:hypothetical protein